MQKNSFLFVVVFLMLTHASFAQKNDSAKNSSHFFGSFSVTNNGISLIPTFSLGKPAAIFQLSMGKGKFSFEPELRFSLGGKPWSFIFWWRYKLWKSDKFNFTVGANPSMNFRTEISPVDGSEIIVTRRYLAGELSPNYLLAKNISIGMYYLYSRGIDRSATRNNHFLTLNTSFSNIKFPKQFFMKLSPQVYYLQLDAQNGFYFSGSMTLAKINFPLSLSAIINRTIQTNIITNKDFVWNVSLMYSFHHIYVKL